MTIKRRGGGIEDIPIVSKRELAEKYLDACVIVTVGDDNAAAAIQEDLKNRGFQTFLSRQVLLHRFEYDGHREKALVCVQGRYILRQVVVSITERCSLRCKNCAQLMPHFQHPEHMDAEDVVKSVSRLTEMVDYIQDVTILGGEPLVHPHLSQICEQIGKLKEKGKIKFASIVSNATIVPDAGLLAVMKHYGIKIMLSDYGPISVKMAEIQNACDAAGVDWRYAYIGGRNEQKIEYWTAVGDLKKQSLPKEQLDRKFAGCNNVYDCNTIYRGRYYFCSFAAFMTGLGNIEMSDDSFDLMKECPIEELKNSWRAFMLEEKTVEACDYCDMHGRVPAAEQI